MAAAYRPAVCRRPVRVGQRVSAWAAARLASRRLAHNVVAVDPERPEQLIQQTGGRQHPHERCVICPGSGHRSRVAGDRAPRAHGLAVPQLHLTGIGPRHGVSLTPLAHEEQSCPPRHDFGREVLAVFGAPQ
jgi:hypothetical protein